MEERVEGMTDNQWDGMIKMFMSIVCESREPEKILKILSRMLKDKTDVEEIMTEFRQTTKK